MKQNTDGTQSPQGLKSEKNTELLQSQTSAQQTETKSQSGEIFKAERIEDTPFTIIKTDEGKICFIAIGNKRITNEKTYVECLQEIREKDWNLIVSLITLITEAVYREITAEDAKELNELIKKGENTHNLLKQMNGKEDVTANT